MCDENMTRMSPVPRSLHGPRRIGPVGALLSAAAMLGWLACACRESSAAEGTIAVRPGEIEFSGAVQGRSFDTGVVMPGYHAVVWRGGRAAQAALIEADVSDRSVIEALKRAGARPGAGLPMESWDRRKDPKSSAPDLTVEGPSVEVLLRIPGRAEPLPLSAVLTDPGGEGIEMRFAGNEANIPIWKSGCIVCLYSCPGSKVGNARYTERDYAKGATTFRIRSGSLPPAGTRIGVVLRVSPSRTSSRYEPTPPP